MDSDNSLFSKNQWYDIKDNFIKTINEEIIAIDENRLLTIPIDDLVQYFYDKYSIAIPVLDEKEIEASDQETKIDLSDYPMYSTYNKSIFVQGTKITIRIPYTGDEEAFSIRPSQWKSIHPCAKHDENSIYLEFLGVDIKQNDLQRNIKGTIEEIKEWLNHLEYDSKPYNLQITGLARSAIESRKEKILANKKLVSSLGFKLTERIEISKTYASPSVKRKIRPVLPKASSQTFTPEPELLQEDYEHILSVLDNMALVMERSPSAFISMGEENLRTQFLVQLNGHFEGNATAETFNFLGKTDILIRENSKNIFIAECKFWGGSKKLIETIDQIMGYSTWRDTKVAIIIFNRNKDFSSVLNIIPDVVQKHPQYKKYLGKRSDTSFKFVFGNKDDPNRELYLTILVFNVPS
ncbi:MAG: hypothetical protein WCW29_04230 [Candidatus Paceibacterota bacterium]